VRSKREAGSYKSEKLPDRLPSLNQISEQMLEFSPCRPNPISKPTPQYNVSVNEASGLKEDVQSQSNQHTRANSNYGH